MRFENKIGESFNNISQRVIYPYLITYPDFLPVGCKEVSIQSQEQLHNFLKDTLLTIYNNPQIINLSVDKDDYFNGEAFKDKPELNGFMKKLEKKFLGFFALLYEIGIVSEVRKDKIFVAKKIKPINKAKLLLLSGVGLICETVNDGVFIYSTDYPELCFSWKLLSETCKKAEGGEKKDAVIVQSITRLLFMKCIFDKKKISFFRTYGDLAQSGGYLKQLEEFFLTKGFVYSFLNADFYLTKQYPKRQESSFYIKFEWRNKNQLWYRIGIANFTSLITQHFDLLSDTLKEFMFYRLKTCDNCGYCTQMNKKERNSLSIKYKHNNETLDKCPLYPWLAWETLDEDVVLIIKELVVLVEKNML